MKENDFIQKLLKYKRSFSVTSEDFAAYTGRRHCDVKRAVKTYITWLKRQGRDDLPLLDGKVYKLKIHHIQGLFRREPERWNQLVSEIENLLLSSGVGEFKKWKNSETEKPVFVVSDEAYHEFSQREMKRMDEMLDVFFDRFYKK